MPANVPGCCHAGGRRLGEAADVHLVDDRLGHRAVERLVALPVVVVQVDDDAAHRLRQVVVRAAGRRRDPRASVVLPLAYGSISTLFAVEAVAAAVQIPRAVHAVGVVRRRASGRARSTCQKWKRLVVRAEPSSIVWNGSTESCSSNSSSSTGWRARRRPRSSRRRASTVAPSGCGSASFDGTAVGRGNRLRPSLAGTREAGGGSSVPSRTTSLLSARLEPVDDRPGEQVGMRRPCGR